jgi:hypothetical protein
VLTRRRRSENVGSHRMRHPSVGQNDNPVNPVLRSSTSSKRCYAAPNSCDWLRSQFGNDQYSAASTNPAATSRAHSSRSSITRRRLGARAEAVQPLFITLDPERDTAVHLAEYVPLFHPRLIGLTGSAEQIRRVALAYRVYYAKYPSDSSDYVIDHSSFICLVDKAGKYIGFFPPGTTADRMIEIINLNLSDGTR